MAGFGADGLAVGESGGRPAYWTGAEHTVHAVPLPAGFEQGSIKAVSAKGLMVGSATRTSDRAAVAFTHQIGSATSEALTTPAAGQSVVDVDVNASGRVVAVDNGVAKEWVNGRAVRELPVPADAIPGTRIVSLTGINKRGDIVGTATGSYFDAENDIEVTKTFPVVWPAGGGYPPYSLQVWNGYHSSFSTIGRDIDDRGTVVGLEHYHYRNDPTRTRPSGRSRTTPCPPTRAGWAATATWSCRAAVRPRTWPSAPPPPSRRAGPATSRPCTGPARGPRWRCRTPRARPATPSAVPSPPRTTTGSAAPSWTGTPRRAPP
ncbi:hypothetical protein WKI68_03005 [Streptomyces sp. MS1.HAVA.3]|uniref:Uncharacterized protein n=1 Tax=Streptomyces caledonius TaxID=3134107 RepID=A0ABU8TYI7_9ACTN